MRRTRVAAVAATLTALAAAVAPAAAAASAASAPAAETKATTAGAVVQASVDDDIVAAAVALGITADDLTAAMAATKVSLAAGPDQTAEAFAAAVAVRIGRTADQVRAALAPMFVERPADPSRPGIKVDQPEPASPLSTDEAATILARLLGVDQASAKTALAGLLALSAQQQGLSATSQPFGDIAASLGVSPQRLAAALGDLKAAVPA